MSENVIEEVVIGGGDIEVNFQEQDVQNVKEEYIVLKNAAITNATTPVFKEKFISNELKSSKRKISKIWSRFTIINRENRIATCNICGLQLSYRGTITNLNTHLLRKHPKYSVYEAPPKSFKRKYKSKPSKRPKLSELAGIDSFIFSAVANEETDQVVELVGQEVEPSELQEAEDRVTHSETFEERFTPLITSVSGSFPSETKQSSSAPRTSNINDRIEKMKNHRILDLQLECLELKKYTMQMETLLMEQQLNLPRSIHTENLRGGYYVTRGTQTEVGGSNTKVFCFTDRHGHSMERSQHLFSFKEMSDD